MKKGEKEMSERIVGGIGGKGMSEGYVIPIMENNGMGGCGGSGRPCKADKDSEECRECVEFVEEPFEFELDTDEIDGEIEECESHYQSILDEGRIGDWTKEDGENCILYAFNEEQRRDLKINRAYLTGLIRFFADYCDTVTGALVNEAGKIDVDRILRSGDAMIVFWGDGTKTVVKRAADEKDSDYAAFTAALGKKIFGSNSKLTRFIKSKIEYQKKDEKKAKEIEGGAGVKQIESDCMATAGNYHHPGENVSAWN